MTKKTHQILPGKQLSEKLRAASGSHIFFRKEDVVDGTTENIREHWGLPHTAAFIFCPLRADKKNPTSVSIYAYDDVKQTRNSDTVYLPKPNNRIIVHNNKEHKFDAAHETMAACVGPISSQYSKV
jgi:hypothetical protein